MSKRRRSRWFRDECKLEKLCSLYGDLDLTSVHAEDLSMSVSEYPRTCMHGMEAEKIFLFLLLVSLKFQRVRLCSEIDKIVPIKAKNNLRADRALIHQEHRHS